MIRKLVAVRFSAIYFSMLRSSRKKSSVGRHILLALLGIYLACVVVFLTGMMFSAICEPFHSLGLDWLYFGMMVMGAFALMVVGSIFFAQSQLYEAKDNELLLSLPVPVSAILGSRMIMLYLINFVYGTMVMLPGMVVYAMKTSVSAVQMVFFCATWLLLPLLALSVSCLIGALLALISSKMKHKSLVVFVLYLAFLGLYFYGYSQLMNGLSFIMGSGGVIAKAIKSYALPVYHISDALASGNVGYFLLSLLYMIVPFAVVYTVLSLTFERMLTAKRGGKRTVYREKSLKVSGSGMALVKKEWQHYIASSGYMLNSSVGGVLLVIAAVFLLVKQDDIQTLTVMLPQLDHQLPVFAVIGITGIMSMNMISAPSVSLEGRSLWILKICPVSAVNILLAKAGFHMLISVPFSLIASVLAIVIIKPDPIMGLMILLIPLASDTLNGLFGVFVNVQLPKLDFISETNVVKNSASVMICMLCQMVYGFGPGLLYVFVFARWISPLAFLLIDLVLTLMLSWLIFVWLKTKGAVLFETLGEN